MAAAVEGSEEAWLLRCNAAERRLAPAGRATLPGPTATAPTALDFDPSGNLWWAGEPLGGSGLGPAVLGVGRLTGAEGAQVRAGLSLAINVFM